RVMFGSVTHPVNENLPDLNAREYATLLPLVALAFWIGIYPKPLFNILDEPVKEIVQHVNPTYYDASVATVTPVAAVPATVASEPAAAPAEAQPASAPAEAPANAQPAQGR